MTQQAVAEVEEGAVPEAPAQTRTLNRLDVSIALTDPGFRKNLIGDLERLGYPKSSQNIEDAAQAAIVVALGKPGGFFKNVPALRKYTFDCAKNFLRNRRHDSMPAGRKSIRLDIGRGWDWDGERPEKAAPIPSIPGEPEGPWGDEAAIKQDGKHTQHIVTGHEPGYTPKAHKRYLREEKKRRRLEEAARTAPSAPIVLPPEDNRDAYEITAADTAALEQVKARWRGGIPTVKKSIRKKGWAAKGRA